LINIINIITSTGFMLKNGLTGFDGGVNRIDGDVLLTVGEG
jgi:hypothetical protein